MTTINFCKLALWAVGLLALYFIAVAFIPLVLLIDIINGLFVGVALAALIVYVPTVCYSLKQPNFNRASQLSVGIALLWLSVLASRMWAGYARHMNYPEDLTNHIIAGLTLFIGLIGGCLFVTAPGYEAIGTAKVPFGGRNRILLLSLGLLGATASTILHYQGNGKDAVEASTERK